MFGQQQQQQSAHNPNKDHELQQTPSDGVTCLKFSPPAIGNFIVAGSWDQKVRCWELQVNKSMGSTPPTINNSAPKASVSHESQVLCCDWSGDGQRVFTGGCDNKGKMWSLQTNQLIQVAQHNEPIKQLIWVEEKQILITGSWDKTIKYWDLRQPTPVLSLDLPDKLFAMDSVSNICVAGTADNKVSIIDLNNPGRIAQNRDSPLKLQTRAISCFPDKSGFALGSIEGRVAIEYFDGPQDNKFTFKCHREGDLTAFSVNCISFAIPYGTFATAGSDGVCNFWDKDNRNRLKQFAKCLYPISATAFNSDASLYAYATSYEWNKGYTYYEPNAPNNIFVHPVSAEEIKKNPKTNKRNR